MQDPQEEIGRIRTDLVRLRADADRLLDVMTPATADFVGERLGKVRVERQTFDARLVDLERVNYHPIDLEAATADALAYLGRFREVLETGSLEQRKEFLRGFVHEIAIDPDAGRGSAPSTSCRPDL